jgi:hypothetical protein
MYLQIHLIESFLNMHHVLRRHLNEAGVVPPHVLSEGVTRCWSYWAV